MEYLTTVFSPLGQAIDIMIKVPMMLIILFGTFLGLLVGALPGFGGSVALCILLPFILDLKPDYALIFMISILSVVNTGDTIPAVLMGIPGTSGAAATVLDGHPMAKRGEAARAFGAAFLASAVGGTFGALILFFIIPVARPIVLLAGSPHLFMLAMLGLSMVAVLSGKEPFKGIAAGAFGLLLASVGGVPGMPFVRYTFGQPYLETHIPLVIVALSIFALPEIVELFITGTQIATTYEVKKGLLEGFKDVFRHLKVVLRGGVIGTIVGILPGLGGSVAAWVAYGNVVQFSKDRSQFGKGDVRGVLAPESSNNAENGGSLIPTLLFGVPGSPAMAVFLASIIMLGIYPGRDMVEQNLHIVYYIALTTAVCSVVGTLICIAFAKWLSLITKVKVHHIIPVMILLVVMGAFQATHVWQDLIMLFGFGIVGWFMKRYGWPRPPLIIGFVLGNTAERYFTISLQRYGFEWVGDPIVIGIGILIIATLFSPLWRRLKKEGHIKS